VNDAGSHLSLLAAALDAAVPRVDARWRWYRIAGERVAVLAGKRSARLLDAFAPLAVAEDGITAGLEIVVFDAASEGVAIPDPLSTRGDGTRGGGLVAAAAAGRRAFYQPEAGVLSLLDESRGRAYCWLRNAAAVPYYEYAAPLRHILQWWMVSRGGALLHSAAVGSGDSGVLITGPSGSGKSETALACQAAGLGFTSDDYVLVRAGAPPFTLAPTRQSTLPLRSIAYVPRSATET